MFTIYEAATDVVIDLPTSVRMHPLAQNFPILMLLKLMLLVIASIEVKKTLQSQRRDVLIIMATPLDI